MIGGSIGRVSYKILLEIERVVKRILNIDKNKKGNLINEPSETRHEKELNDIGH